MASTVALALSTAVAAQTKTSSKADVAIKRALIAQSIARYSGSCPCPYNTDRAGRSCGRRSAYSKPGGASPLCYEADVTPHMVEQYRKLSGNVAKRR